MSPKIAKAFVLLPLNMRLKKSKKTGKESLIIVCVKLRKIEQLIRFKSDRSGNKTLLLGEQKFIDLPQLESCYGNFI